MSYLQLLGTSILIMLALSIPTFSGFYVLFGMPVWFGILVGFGYSAVISPFVAWSVHSLNRMARP